jgi:hypothetical protein
MESSRKWLIAQTLRPEEASNLISSVLVTVLTSYRLPAGWHDTAASDLVMDQLNADGFPRPEQSLARRHGEVVIQS